MQEPWKTPTILGVKFDPNTFQVKVTDQRREALVQEIDEIIKSDHMASGQAAKLKGKLMFASVMSSATFAKRSRSAQGEEGRARMELASKTEIKFANRQNKFLKICEEIYNFGRG